MADLEATIRGVEEQLWKAQLSGDVAVLDDLIADDLLFTGLAGSLETKAADLQQHRSGALKITKLDPVEFHVRAIPGGAITSVKMDAAAIIAGKLTSAILRYTRVWISEGGRWQIAGGHMSIVG
ncbi:MAG TPA: nuclear transport factor 2 family protein [Polyangiaceae bacterium]|nr:nuclear transport factor 2 family protein [Polyangiaceae bacterium]